MRPVRWLPPLLLLAAALALWQAYVVLAKVPDFLLPGPVEIWQATVAERELLATNAVPTLQIALIGFALAVASGFVLAVAIYLSRWLEMALYPVLIASQSVPLIALAPILVVLLGFTILPKLIIVALICFFPIVVNTVDGFRSTDPDLLNLVRSLGAGPVRTFRDVTLPTALPYFFSGAKVAATYSVIGALVGEWVGSWQGLGYLMTQEMSQFNTAVLFSAMGILTVMGIGMFGALALAERLLMPWYQIEKKRKRVR